MPDPEILFNPRLTAAQANTRYNPATRYWFRWGLTAICPVHNCKISPVRGTVCFRWRGRLRTPIEIYCQPGCVGAELLLADHRTQVHQGGCDAENVRGGVPALDQSTTGSDPKAHRCVRDRHSEAV